MKRLSVIAVLLLCTCLWIVACGAPSEILTVEMYDNYMTQEPILLSVVMPPSYDVTELLFQINGMVYHTKNLPTEEDPYFHLTAEDGEHTASLKVLGCFGKESPLVILQFFPDAEGKVSYPEDVWFGNTEEFLPLFSWFDKAANKT